MLMVDMALYLRTKFRVFKLAIGRSLAEMTPYLLGEGRCSY